MFKNHPNKKNIKFIVLPIARGIIRTFASIPMNVYKLIDKYKKGSI